MADDNKLAVPGTPGNLAPLPSYMEKSHEDISNLSKYVTLPRLALCQNLSKPKVIEEIGETGVYVSNDTILNRVADPIPMEGNKRKTYGPEFIVRPIFFYEEFILWNDRRAEGEDPILDMSYDLNSEIARRALKSDTRVIPHPKNPAWKQNYVQHLNFICLIEEHEGIGPVVISFCKGEHKTGRKFSGLIARRGNSIYTGRYTFCVEQHASKDGRWWGFRIANPNQNPWVSEEQYKLQKGRILIAKITSRHQQQAQQMRTYRSVQPALRTLKSSADVRSL